MEQGSYLFYYIFPIVVSIMALIGYKKPKTGFLIMLILLFFSMFRGDNVGSDTKSYISDNRIQYRGSALDLYFSTDYLIENFGSNIELIDIVINWFIYDNNLSPRIIIWFYAIVTIVFLYLATKRFKANLTLVALFYLFLGYYYLSFNIARQLASISIVLFAISYLTLQSKRSLLFFLWIILASLIHMSAIFSVILYFIKNIHISRKKALTIVAVIYSLSLLIPVTTIFLNLLSRSGIIYAQSYGNDGDFAIQEKSLIGIIFHLINGFLLLTIYKLTSTQKKTDLLDNCFLLSLLIFSLLYHGNLGTYRFTFLFTVFQCVYLSVFFEMNLKKSHCLFLLILVLNYYLIIQYDDGAYYLCF